MKPVDDAPVPYQGFTAIVLLVSVLIVAILSVIVFQSLYGSPDGEQGTVEQGVDAVDQAEKVQQQLNDRTAEHNALIEGMLEE